MKNYPKALTYKGQRCDIQHFTVDSFGDIEDNLIEKVHAVCMYNNKFLLVNHPEWNIWGIPGGTREKNESLEETLRREIQEETNCNVIKFTPISYDKVIDDVGNFHYRVHYFCKVEPISEFEFDTAGNIDKIDWINPNDFENYIENKEFKKNVIQNVIDNLKHYENI